MFHNQVLKNNEKITSSPVITKHQHQVYDRAHEVVVTSCEQTIQFRIYPFCPWCVSLITRHYLKQGDREIFKICFKSNAKYVTNLFTVLQCGSEQNRHYVTYMVHGQNAEINFETNQSCCFLKLLSYANTILTLNHRPISDTHEDHMQSA